MPIPWTQRHPRDPPHPTPPQGTQRDPRGPKGPKGRGQGGPKGPRGMGPWGPLGLFRSHSEWKVISSGRLFRKERGGWAHGALWGNSEAIPNGMDGHFEWKVIPVCTLRFGTYRTPGRPCKISGTSRGTSLKWPKTWASSNKPRGLNLKPFGPPGLDLERFGPPELDLKPFGYPRLDLGAFGPPGLDL